MCKILFAKVNKSSGLRRQALIIREISGFVFIRPAHILTSRVPTPLSSIRMKVKDSPSLAFLKSENLYNISLVGLQLGLFTAVFPLFPKETVIGLPFPVVTFNKLWDSGSTLEHEYQEVFT